MAEIKKHQFSKTKAPIAPKKSLVKSALKLFSKEFWFNARLNLVNKLISSTYGRKMYLSPTAKGTVAGCTVFWYFEGGQRKFIMVKEPREEGAPLRFVGCIDDIANKPLNEIVTENVAQVLGDTFLRTLDPRFFDIDRVASAPAFIYEDEESKIQMPVQCICWVVQITAEQANLASPSEDAAEFEVLSVPEFALVGNEIADSHKIIYQSVMRHIHNHSDFKHDILKEASEDLLKKADRSGRTLH